MQKKFKNDIESFELLSRVPRKRLRKYEKHELDRTGKWIAEYQGEESLHLSPPSEALCSFDNFKKATENQGVIGKFQARSPLLKTLDTKVEAYFLISNYEISTRLKILDRIVAISEAWLNTNNMRVQESPLKGNQKTAFLGNIFSKKSTATNTESFAVDGIWQIKKTDTRALLIYDLFRITKLEKDIVLNFIEDIMIEKRKSISEYANMLFQEFLSQTKKQ